MLGAQEKRKDKKTQKVGGKRKWRVIAKPPYSRKREAVIFRVEPFNQGDRPPNVEENPGNRYRQMLKGQARPRAHSRYIHI